MDERNRSAHKLNELVHIFAREMISCSVERLLKAQLITSGRRDSFACVRVDFTSLQKRARKSRGSGIPDVLSKLGQRKNTLQYGSAKMRSARMHWRKMISKARECRAFARNTLDIERTLVAYIGQIRIIDGYYQFRLLVDNRWRVGTDTDRISTGLWMMVDNMKHLAATIVTLATDDRINARPYYSQD